MLTVDINQFEMWMEGTLLYRDTQKMVAVNEIACEEAENALLRGEKVYLMRGNRLTGTYIVLENDAFVEKDSEIK